MAEDQAKLEELREAAAEHVFLLIDADEDTRRECGCLYADVARLVIACVEAGYDEFADEYVGKCRARLTAEAAKIHDQHRGGE